MGHCWNHSCRGNGADCFWCFCPQLFGRKPVWSAQKVEAYLDAIVDGEASVALDLLDANVTNNGRALLTDEVYAAVEDRPTEYSIDSVRTIGKSAEVTAKVKQNGKNHKVVFSLTKDGRQAVIFDDWRMTQGMDQHIFVFQAPETLAVNGVDVTVTVTPQQTETRIYTTSDVPAVAFNRGYTQAVVDDVLAQVEPLLDACVASTTIVVEGCEIASWEDNYWDGMKNIKRRWETEPKLVVSSGDQENLWAKTQPEPAGLSGPLSVYFVDGVIKMDYSVTLKGYDEWYDYGVRCITPFFEHDGNQYSDLLALPITIDGDKLTVDTSKLSKQHSGWVQ